MGNTFKNTVLFAVLALSFSACKLGKLSIRSVSDKAAAPLTCDPGGYPFGAGTGTLADPYFICSRTQLIEMGGVTHSAEYFALDADIDLGGAATPFTSMSTIFHGQLDGAGHTISNLDSTSGGLWVTIGAGSVIKNLTLANVSINATDNAGSLANNITSATIQNVTVNTANITQVTAMKPTGGLAGQSNTSTYTGISVNNITLTSPYAAGGAIGQATSITVNNSVATSVTITGADSVGGFIGRTFTSTFTDTHSSGTITGGNAPGGLIGWGSGITVTTCYSDATVGGNGNNNGGLVGWATTASSITKSFAKGSVTNTGMSAGGLVGGLFNSSITLSFATGNVGGTGNNKGGLVGNSVAPTANTIQNVFSTGTVGSTGAVIGGLVGGLSNTSLSKAYSLAPTVTGGVASIGTSYGGNTLANIYYHDNGSVAADGNASGLTAAQIIASGSYATFDFAGANGWRMPTSVGGVLPALVPVPAWSCNLPSTGFVCP